MPLAQGRTRPRPDHDASGFHVETKVSLERQDHFRNTPSPMDERSTQLLHPNMYHPTALARRDPLPASENQYRCRTPPRSSPPVRMDDPPPFTMSAPPPRHRFLRPTVAFPFSLSSAHGLPPSSAVTPRHRSHRTFFSVSSMRATPLPLLSTLPRFCVEPTFPSAFSFPPSSNLRTIDCPHKRCCSKYVVRLPYASSYCRCMLAGYRLATINFKKCPKYQRHFRLHRCPRQTRARPALHMSRRSGCRRTARFQTVQRGSDHDAESEPGKQEKVFSVREDLLNAVVVSLCLRRSWATTCGAS